MDNNEIMANSKITNKSKLMISLSIIICQNLNLNQSFLTYKADGLYQNQTAFERYSKEGGANPGGDTHFSHQ